ncbi:MAG: Gfo/Idh/MocA family oxidoreductase [Chloroflexia bacterium]|jgi:predicted dehydrogenase|nr:Gfo/Idh/MocA family oxidoreductase [Chloroflexia bacterium]
MSHSFKVGIVGAGVIGTAHAGALEGIDNATVVAIAEPREEAGRTLADKYEAHWHSSYTDMLADPEIDIVILGTPSGLHPEQTILAAGAGKHVVTEKPMSITHDGATRMIEAVDRAGVTLAVIFQNRLSRDVYRVKRAIESELIGKPILGSASVYWHRSQDYYDANGGWRGTWALDGGGVLINQSIHTIDILQWLLGGVASVQAHVATLNHQIEAEDAASASLRFHSGAVGSILVTTSAAADYPTRVEIVGTEGRVTLENNVVSHFEGKGELSDELLSEDDLHTVRDWKPVEAFGEGHRRQLRLIFDALAAGKEPPVPGREARKAVDVILGIYESARSGMRVNIAGSGAEGQ